VNPVNISVDGIVCASAVPIDDGETKTVACNHYGRVVRLNTNNPSPAFMTICEFEVMVRNEKQVRSEKQACSRTKSRLLITESAGTNGALGAGLGQFSSAWSADAKIILEWGSGSYISFRSAHNVNPFVDRPGTRLRAKNEPATKAGGKYNNTLIHLSDFATSDANLESWVTSAGGG
jgi:hypothetical protein